MSLLGSLSQGGEPDERAAEFAALFDQACDEARGERHRTILALRFGLADGRPRTLRQIGIAYSLSRERIRQLEDRALRRVVGRGKNYLRRNQPEWHQRPCASLLRWVEDIVRPGEDGDAERLLALGQYALPVPEHNLRALRLLAILAGHRLGPPRRAWVHFQPQLGALIAADREALVAKLVI